MRLEKILCGQPKPYTKRNGVPECQHACIVSKFKGSTPDASNHYVNNEHGVTVMGMLFELMKYSCSDVMTSK